MQTGGVPGFPCPDCQHPICASLHVLLAGEVVCGNCGLVLRVDHERSKRAIEGLRVLNEQLKTIGAAAPALRKPGE